MRKIDPNYINDEKYIPYKELTDQERENMLARYEELLPFYKSKAEVIDARGFCPMDILHEIVLTEKKQAWATERTMKTQAIRESEKHEEYLYGLDTSEEQSDFSVLSYIQKHEDELSMIFKVKTN
ncbi:hypothetical protein [Carboxylicivirga marina]|uniref:Uncharacterized protein n=1 Tax=Carboxylicivirga marina TaxID=2800988 RepID=A0ABS1HGH2_9BACT|nr:hypothetical protein [Carboxylicivirga marina]MBK3516691.1 hypothetical protein [Carboxylicivirga marina]